MWEENRGCLSNYLTAPFGRIPFFSRRHVAAPYPLVDIVIDGKYAESSTERDALHEAFVRVPLGTHFGRIPTPCQLDLSLLTSLQRRLVRHFPPSAPLCATTQKGGTASPPRSLVLL